ncbi:MAG TPA: MFS transporter [Candidatus Acidoferrales bacterium]|jgi:SHS family lactate transporter-like MFS transporter|nr:MFS transporter [Candidatus Acidoferrales bacterium]
MSDAQRANSRNAVIAGFLGWTLDAFDYFILTYVLGQVAAEFHKSIAAMTLTLTASLVMRPVGAVLFGLLADRYGRRMPLMLNVLCYSVIEILSGFAPSYAAFFALRLLYGIAMGGEWGVGASLVMESVPTKWRGIISGVLQEGYALGNLLGAIAFWTIFPHWGWRVMFFVGGLPALLTLFIRAKVKESDAWRAEAVARKNWSEYFRAVGANWKRFVYLVGLLAMMNCMSHGTQDLYPTFLQKEHHFDPRITAILTAISMVGAIAGGTLFGLYSDRRGRRRAMITAALLGLLLIPAWVFAPPVVALMAAAAFLMQFMVQGAWGVIPVHINELSPGALRGFFPGFAYQLGVLVAAPVPWVEALMSRHLGYGAAMGTLAAAAFVVGSIVIAAGPEAHRVAFGAEG